MAQEMSYGTGRKWHTVTRGNGELAKASHGASVWRNASDTRNGGRQWRVDESGWRSRKQNLKGIASQQSRKMDAGRRILWMAGHGNSVHGWSLVIVGRVANQVDAAELLPRQTLIPLMKNEMLPIRCTLIC